MPRSHEEAITSCHYVTEDKPPSYITAPTFYNRKANEGYEQSAHRNENTDGSNINA
jgi:hypothetical protein